MSKERVVCINDSFVPAHPNVGQLPKQGEIYTVLQGYKALNGMDYFILSELDHDDAFRIDHFRPIDSHYGEWVESTLMKDAVLEETLKQIEI